MAIGPCRRENWLLVLTRLQPIHNMLSMRLVAETHGCVLTLPNDFGCIFAGPLVARVWYEGTVMDVKREFTDSSLVGPPVR